MATNIVANNDFCLGLSALFYVPFNRIHFSEFRCPRSLTNLARDSLGQRTLVYFVRGNNAVQLTSCLTGLDSAVLLN